VTGYKLSPDGTRLVYALQEPTDQVVVRLVSVPALGGSAKTLINIPLDSDAFNQRSIADFAISGDSASVVFLSDKDAAGQGTNDLFRVAIDGSGSAIKLNTAPAPSDISDFGISDDSARVVFETLTNVFYSVATGGGTPVSLGGITGSFLPRYRIAPDSTRVVFPFDDGSGGGVQIYSIPIAGGPAVKLSNQTGVSLTTVTFTPDGMNVLYLANTQQEIWVTPVASSAPLRLVGPTALYGPDLRMTPDGKNAIFVAGSYPNMTLNRVAVDGGSPVRQLSNVGDGIAASEFQMSADGQHFVYRLAKSRFRLFAVTFAGQDAVELTLSVLTGIGAYNGYRIDPTSHFAVYSAEAATPGVVELFSASLAAGNPTKLTKDPMPAFADVQPGDVTISPDGASVAYVADQDTDEVQELYSTAIAGGPPTKLHPDLAPDKDVGSTVPLFTNDSTSSISPTRRRSACSRSSSPTTTSWRRDRRRRRP